MREPGKERKKNRRHNEKNDWHKQEFEGIEALLYKKEKRWPLSSQWEAWFCCGDSILEAQEKSNTPECTHKKSVTNQSWPPGGEKTIVDMGNVETNMERSWLPLQGSMLFLISAFLTTIIFLNILGKCKQHGNNTIVPDMDHVTLENTVILTSQE